MCCVASRTYQRLGVDISICTIRDERDTRQSTSEDLPGATCISMYLWATVQTMHSSIFSSQ